MVRIGTAAAAMGMVAGVWNVAESLLSCAGGATSLCPAMSTAPPGLEGTITVVLAVLLVLDSLVCLIGPRIAFYSLALIALLIDLIVAINYSSIAPYSLYVTLALVSLSLALGLVAARERTGVSEQSHPMNLPVFG